ncbi:MBL fold metallo-hydrolase [Streptomyces sp. NPDC057582]|uniref:MBL fold metallo-hydrolase n=1 Tax=Streptomyces sp. NPDC057582 TaxID=3346174 RepID=UPI0036B897CD
MIEPSRIGDALLADINRDVAEGSVVIWPLEQSGLALRFPGRTVYIDLYLSNHCEAVLARPFDHRRMSRAPLDASEIVNADVVICSHDHLDHLDVPTLRSLRDSSPQAVVVAPLAARSTLLDLGWPGARIRSTKGGETVEVAGLCLTSFPVPHDDYDEDSELGHPYQGYVVSDGRATVAHVGDARADARLAAELARHAADLLCLPINGRDEHRAALGFAGNMNAAEAVELAASAGVRRVMPMHYDMFDQNVDPHALDGFRTALTSRPALEMIRPGIGDAAVIESGRSAGAGARSTDS